MSTGTIASFIGIHHWNMKNLGFDLADELKCELVHRKGVAKKKADLTGKDRKIPPKGCKMT